MSKTSKTEEMRRVNRLNDYFFKWIFGRPEGEILLVSFLNAVLDYPPDQQIVSLQYVNPSLGPRRLREKASVLDILVKLASGTQINVEVQLQRYPAMAQRMLYYLASLYTSQLPEGAEYETLRPVVGINILGHVRFPEDRRVHRVFEMRERETGALLRDDLTLHFIEVPKMTSPDLKSALDRWVHYLSGPPPVDLEALAATDPIIEMALEREKRFLRNQREWLAYLHRERDLMDKASWEGHHRRELERSKKEALEQGLEEGLRLGLDKGLQKGLDEGRLKGLDEGRLKGLDEGRLKGLDEGRLKGLDEGRQKGREEALLKVARGLLRSGMDSERVAALMDIDLEALRELMATDLSETVLR